LLLSGQAAVHAGKPKIGYSKVRGLTPLLMHDPRIKTKSTRVQQKGTKNWRKVEMEIKLKGKKEKKRK
jgi:hypothetical protein